MEMKWIPIKDRLPEDEQPVVYLTVNGYSDIAVFYKILFDATADEDDNAYSVIGLAGHWGGGEYERLYWFPLPSFYNVPGVGNVNKYYIQRELKEGENNDDAA